MRIQSCFIIELKDDIYVMQCKYGVSRAAFSGMMMSGFVERIISK